MLYLKCGLFECKVSFFRSDSVEIPSESKVFEVGNDSLHFMTVYAMDVPAQAGDYLVRASKKGYKD